MKTDEIVSHLPLLLRYARGLTLSTEEGEALVEAALEAMLRGEASPDASKPLRTALLELVHQQWIPLDRRPPASAGGGDDLFGVLSRAAPHDRAVLLLVRFEGLSEAEAAQVLRMTLTEVARRLTRAEQRLFQLANPRILIVDDGEPRNVDWDRLAIEVGGELIGPVAYRDALASASSEKPDLVVAAAGSPRLEAELAAAEKICKSCGAPLILLSDTPERVPALSWIERDFIATAPVEPALLVSMVRRALARIRTG